MTTLTGDTMRISTSWITVEYGGIRWNTGNFISFFRWNISPNSKNSLQFSRWTWDNECFIAQLAIWNFNDTGHPVVRWMRDGLFSELYSNFWFDLCFFMPIPRLESASSGSAWASCSLN